ncbi:MAG: HAD-IA family hydrolase [Methyloligellaceae bacterium]
MRLVIFDCDGTLVDSQHMIVKAMEMTFAEMGYGVPDRDAVRSIIGLSLPEAMQSLRPDESDSQIDLMVDAYRTAFFELRSQSDDAQPLFEGAAAALRQLAAEDGVVLGIATGKSRRGVKNLCERYGFDSYFATIQTADDAPSKPHPAMIDQAMHETGIDASQTMMIGDTVFDVAMARNADVKAVGVTWGYHPARDLKDAGAHWLCSNFPEVLNVISMFRENQDAHRNDKKR